MPDAPPITERRVAERLERAGLALEAGQALLLSRYLNLLVKWNRVYNLTGIRDERLLIERHLLESLALGPLLGRRRIADVGTGAGLPGIPLALTHRQRDFTLIESRSKRVRFLRHVLGALDIGNAAVAHGRAESLRFPAPFDTVLARAVAAPDRLLGILRPLTVPGSRVLLLTGVDLRAKFDGLAEDFVLREPGSPPSSALRSAIVVLERVAAPDVIR